ncbi:hypothetical protein CTAYLR_006232, partial [Chrysophaeum taylorii]
ASCSPRWLGTIQSIKKRTLDQNCELTIARFGDSRKAIVDAPFLFSGKATLDSDHAGVLTYEVPLKSDGCLRCFYFGPSWQPDPCVKETTLICPPDPRASLVIKTVRPPNVLQRFFRQSPDAVLPLKPDTTTRRHPAAILEPDEPAIGPLHAQAPYSRIAIASFLPSIICVFRQRRRPRSSSSPLVASSICSTAWGEFADDDAAFDFELDTSCGNSVARADTFSFAGPNGPTERVPVGHANALAHRFCRMLRRLQHQHGCRARPFEHSSLTPSEIPSTRPTSMPSPRPTAIPSMVPSREPTSVPSANPTSIPTTEPTSMPSDTPTLAPTLLPTPAPTLLPSARPSSGPTMEPTNMPSQSPTQAPTPLPSAFLGHALRDSEHGPNCTSIDAAERVSSHRRCPRSSVVLSYDSANLDAFCGAKSCSNSAAERISIGDTFVFPKRSAFRFAIIQPFGEPNGVANPCTVADAHDRAVASTNHGADSRPNDAAERVSVGLTNRVANSRAIVVAHSSSVVLSYDSAYLDAFCGAKSCTNPVAKRASVIDTLVSSKLGTLDFAIIQTFGEPNDVANPCTVADAHDRAVASTNHGADSRPNDAAERVSVGLTNRAANSRAIVVAHSSSVVLSYDSANLDAFCGAKSCTNPVAKRASVIDTLVFPKRSAFRFAIIQPFGEPNDVANPCTVADAHGRAVASTNHGADSRPIDAAERVAIVAAHSPSVVLSYDSADLDALCYANSCTNPVAKRASVIDTLVSSKLGTLDFAIIQTFGEPNDVANPCTVADAHDRVAQAPTMVPTPDPTMLPSACPSAFTNRVANSRAIVVAHSSSVVLSYDSANLDAFCGAVLHSPTRC